ncbi:MAG: hypothetical protein Q7I94_03400 [Candidatus Contubernalis sp.]|nr:hypothetical protein [Candidatus Contubernalis sp.]
MKDQKNRNGGFSQGRSPTSDSIIFPRSNSSQKNKDHFNKEKKQGPNISDDLEKEEKAAENNIQETKESILQVSENPDIKTVILWIYNINQNGSANNFQEEMSSYLTNDEKGNVFFNDLDENSMAELLANLSMSKEIVLKDLGVRLLLFIINCNQNGSSNSAVSCLFNGAGL